VNGPSGIYQITNVVTGEFYVGRAAFINARIRQHFNQLAAGKHKNHLLQASYDQHGRAAFTFEIKMLGEWLCNEEWDLIGKLRPPFNLAGPHIPTTRKGKRYSGHSEKMKAYWRRRKAGLAPGFYSSKPTD
jgi:hypothetical protein